MRKYILYIFVVIMALSLTLCAVSAEDAVNETLTAQNDSGETPVTQNAAGEDSTDEASPVEDVSVGYFGGGNRYTFYRSGTGQCDYCVIIKPTFDYNNIEVEAGDSFSRYIESSYGPALFMWHADFTLGSTRTFTIYGNYNGDVNDVVIIYEGQFDFLTFYGRGGDESTGEINVSKEIDTKEASPIKEANLTGETNLAKEVKPAEKVSASEKTLPATGNPLAMALLAMGIGGIGRKF